MTRSRDASRADHILALSLTPICSAGTPSTAAIATGSLAPCRTSARDQRRFLPRPGQGNTAARMPEAVAGSKRPMGNAQDR
jgi:hypothetical protein